MLSQSLFVLILCWKQTKHILFLHLTFNHTHWYRDCHACSVTAMLYLLMVDHWHIHCPSCGSFPSRTWSCSHVVLFLSISNLWLQSWGVGSTKVQYRQNRCPLSDLLWATILSQPWWCQDIMQYYWHHIPELEEGEILRDSWWVRRPVWTEWTNCPASPATIVVIAQGLWWGNGFQGASLLIPHCCVQNYDSLCDSTCRVSKNFIYTLALSLTHTVHVGILHIWGPFSTWTMGVQNRFNIIENRSAMCILCIAEHMCLMLKISIRVYGISRLKLGVVWMLLHNYTIKSIAGCRKF